MGHIRLGTLPKSQKWNQVVSLIAGGADVEQIAAASADAAENGLERASDEGLGTCVLAADANTAGRPAAQFLRTIVGTGPERPVRKPTLFEIVAAFSRAVDGHVRAANALTLGRWRSMLLPKLSLLWRAGSFRALFGPTATDVQQALAKLGRSDQFSIVARDFFSRLTSRSLGYFLSRELSKHVGPERDLLRSATIAISTQHWTCIAERLRGSSKSFQADGTVRRFNEKKQISQDDARKFAHVAFKKLRAELRKRRDADV